MLDVTNSKTASERGDGVCSSIARIDGFRNFSKKEKQWVYAPPVEAAESDYQVNSALDVADVILAHPMASKTEKDYTTQIKAAV